MAELVWWPAKGYGFLTPESKFLYDEAYFEHCKTQEATEVGRGLVGLRCRFVARSGPSVVDVGIGGGAFVRANECCGYDVCREAINWLRERGDWHDLSKSPVYTACFFDSLEHMLTPEALLSQVSQEVFVSMPIYQSAEHALKSKHYKPNEHMWYFTEPGLVGWMKKQGLNLVERNRDEERYGREDIGSYKFVRQL